jgi:hypothetical protein
VGSLPTVLPASHSFLIGHDQRVKSNKNDCKRLAGRALDILCDIHRQTKDYGRDVPVEVKCSIDRIKESVVLELLLDTMLKFSRVFQETIDFMKDLERQGLGERYARQDANKSRIEDLTRMLDGIMELFEVMFLRGRMCIYTH